MGLRWVWKERLDASFAVLSVTNTGRRGRERTHPSALARPLASPAAVGPQSGPQSGAGGARPSGDRPAPCAELCPVGATGHQPWVPGAAREPSFCTDWGPR